MEWVKNNLTLLSIGLLILGTVNLVLYYSYFNIDILSYLDFTEVFQIQFKLFAITAAAFVGFIMFMSFFTYLSGGTATHPAEEEAIKNSIAENKIKAISKKHDLIVGDIQEPELVSKRKKGFFAILDFENRRYGSTPKKASAKFNERRTGLAVLPMFALPLLIQVMSNASLNTMFKVYIASIPLFLIFTILAYVGIRKDIRESFSNPPMEEIQAKRDLYKVIGCFVFLVFSSGAYARLSAMNILLYSSRNELSFVLDNKAVSTNFDYRFIGKTKNYFFFYDIPKKQASVFAVSDIKSLLIKDGVSYSVKPAVKPAVKAVEPVKKL